MPRPPFRKWPHGLPKALPFATGLGLMALRLALAPRIDPPPVQPKRIELFPQGTHDDLFDHGAWEKTRAFLAAPGG